MKPAKDGTTTYGIAKSSEVSEDGLTHTYKLRDAKWSNGDAVTANDFVYAWQRIFKKKETTITCSVMVLLASQVLKNYQIKSMQNKI